MTRRRAAPYDGLVVVDKPSGWTSHDVVARVRRLAGTRRVGHAGTLDPMATGVLVLGIGKATRLLGPLSAGRKAYDATVRFGQATTTDDAEGETLSVTSAAAVTDEAVTAGLHRWSGDIDQVPSAFSAVKVDGVRSYVRARAGERVELTGRRVRIERLDLRALRRHDTDAPDTDAPDTDAHGAPVLGAPVLDAELRIECSSGTYIRALARDLGAELGVGGHLTALRRGAVGPYALDAAYPLVELERLAEAGRFVEALIGLGEAVATSFPRRDVGAEEASRLAHGAPLPAAGPGAGLEPGPVGVFGPDGQLVALVEETAGRAKPTVVFAPADGA